MEQNYLERNNLGKIAQNVVCRGMVLVNPVLCQGITDFGGRWKRLKIGEKGLEGRGVDPSTLRHCSVQASSGQATEKCEYRITNVARRRFCYGG
jgi:hypothetical protein